MIRFHQMKAYLRTCIYAYNLLGSSRYDYLYLYFLIKISPTSYISVQILRVLFGLNRRIYYLLLLLTFGALFYIGVNTSPIIVFVFSVCTVSLLFSIYLTSWVLAKDEGPPEMSEVKFLNELIFRFTFVCFCNIALLC